MKLLNLGCGNSYHKDWINLDFVSNSQFVLQHNLLEGIPIEDNKVNVVYHSHVLEHFSKEDGLIFIKECYRVLDHRGIIRVAVPDLERIAREYLKNLQLAIDGNNDAKFDYEWIKLELLDQMVRNKSGGGMKDYLFQTTVPNEKYVFDRIGSEGKIIREAFLENSKRSQEKSQEKNPEIQRINLKSFFKSIKKKIAYYKKDLFKSKKIKKCDSKEFKIGEFRNSGEIHQWMYDRYSLSELLKSVGFVDVKVLSAFESEIYNWENYQLDVINGLVRKPDSLFIEAKKK